MYYNHLMLEPDYPPIWIDTETDLTKMVDHLLKFPKIAVDTKSNGLHAFQEKVCLLQFSVPNADYLVDSILLTNLSPLGKIFSSPAHEKIFHAAEYDIICLKRDYQFSFCNIFDTMMAARILGIKEVGLDGVLRAELGLEIDKRLQKANWAKRPLPEDQMIYARFDTYYLDELRDIYEARLNAKNLIELAREDFARLTRVCGSTPNTLEEQLWKTNGVRDLNQRQVTILYELLKWREAKAKQLDRPSFKVIGSNFLVQAALTLPTNLFTLRSRTDIPERLIDHFGKEILACIELGQTKPIQKQPRIPKKDKALRDRIELLKQYRKEEASRREVDSDIVLPREIMLEIAENPPATMEDIRKQMSDYPWRLNEFGKQILKALNPDERIEES